MIGIIAPRFPRIIIDALFSENKSRFGTLGKSRAAPITEIHNRLLHEIDDLFLDSDYY
jgi:hypothetical protein